MSPLWLAFISAVIMVVIDVASRWFARRGVALLPMPRRGSTMQTAIAAGAVVAVAWLLDAAGLLDQIVTSNAARVAVVVVIIGLQLATLLSLALIIQRRSRPS
jgi:hypothetical protein